MSRTLPIAVGLLSLLAAQTVQAQGVIIGSNMDRLFYELDDDHDGVIEREEARASPLLSAYFAEADTNADDGIDRVEFAVFESNSGGGGGTPYGGGGVGGAAPGGGGTGGAATGGPTGPGAPAGTPPPTSSGPADSLTAPGLPAGTPPPTSSSGIPGIPGAPPPTSSGTPDGTTGGFTGGTGETTGGATGGAGGGTGVTPPPYAPRPGP